MKSTLLLIVTAVTLIFFPKINFGQVITLGPDASRFVIFTSSGAVGDNASAHSHITGDVGTLTSGPITGFGNIDGIMHPGVDPATTACDIALGATIAQINANPATLVGPLSLGSGATLTPGIYSIPGNATLTLDLILDGQGNPNAEFIFKVAGTFATNTLSRVKLINGALACHVYWKIDGAVTMASLSTMRGNIISGGLIQMGSGDSLEGRAFSTPAGAITIDGITAYMPVGCGSAVLTGPPAPDLASLYCYTIFSSIGALDGNLSSTSIGDVGNAGGGSVTGWTAGNVTGALHPTGDPSTMLAATDLTNIYNTLNAMVPDIELLYPVQFGRNLVLTPHVYLLSSGGANGPATLTDSLYLDAQGNSNAVFVFKIIGGGLTTSVSSRVKLINGAQAKNVFWMIDGAVSINDNSIFRGNIIVSAGALNLEYTGVVLDGRALTINGAITTAGLAAAMTPGCGALPCNPIIITQPTNQIACASGSVSFTVAATGSNLTYQWRKGNVNILGATNDTLTIDPVSILDAGLNYNVVVSGSCPPNDTSINVSLTVNALPFIITQPVNQIACVGDSVSFIVAATGTGLTYQWRKGNVNILGATNDTLTIDPVNILDAGLNYNVVVSGLCSSDTSNNISLTVNALPFIITQPVNQIACVGDSVSFIVAATGSGLTYQWRKGTINILGATNDTLTIDPVSILDAGLNYNVVVSGTCSSDTSNNVSLTVNSVPIIITQPVNQVACAGDSISFIVAATGTGLAYQWRKGTVNILGATNDTLTIDPVSILDAGLNYNVIVSGTCSSDTSINVSLAVNTATVIITSPVSQAVCVGDSVSFFVVASGTGLTYQWRKGTVNLINGGNISGATSDTLTINPVTLADTASNYNVVVTGGCNSLILPSLAVNLQSAGDFGILAGTAITSTGFSVINNMDVGLSPGVHSSITGFPPATVVNGVIIAADDPGAAAILTQAKQDLTDAYLFAEGATAPAPATVAGDQGGKTLAPGIYKSTSTLLIQSGDLTLDAQGDANATWIFQIAAGFTTIGGAGGNVILTGGAQAKNVFWQVGSSATIGNGTSFKGNILALTSITMNTGSSIDGRLLARNGAVVLSGTNIINKPSDTVTTNLTSTTSINVSLIVNTAPIIITQPVNQIACVGDSVSFTVVATGSGLSYQWRKGNVNIAGATSATYTINPVNISDAALNYNVVIVGTCSNDTSINVSLTVNAATLIIIQPVNQIACVGDSVSFTVVATGTGLTYQWRKGNVDIVGATSSTYTINPVTVADAALIYNVVILGTCSGDTSINVSLTVNSAPIIITQPVSQTACIGDSVSFTVVATGTGLIYQWRNGTIDITGANSSTLTINPVTISDAAINYNVVITGTCSNDVSVNVSLTVNALPVAIAISNSPVCLGSSIDLTAQTVAGATYQWTSSTEFTSTVQNPVIPTSSLSDAGTYSLVVTANGCTSVPSTITVVVNNCPVTEFFIPEGFSPNGDGINDLFVIRGILDYPNNTFQIFNRWGNKVYEASPYENTWDGKSTMGLRVGGDDLPVGTYFYVLDLGDGSKVYKGTIYLNR